MEFSQNLGITHAAAPVRVSTNNHKLKKTTAPLTNYRGVMEESGASHAQQQTGNVRLPGVTGNTPASTAVRVPGVTGNTPAPTAVRLPGVTGNTTAPTTTTTVNNNGADALRSVSVNVMGGRGTLISSKQATPATTNFARESRDTRSPMAAALAFDQTHKHLIVGAGTSVSLSSGTAVDLTWPLVCVRCEAAVCLYY